MFSTDKQTLDDLNVFGSHGSESLFNIFNRSSTRGGAAVLEEMFRYPLTDEAAINRRLGIIGHFFKRGNQFPFNNTQFDAVETYLANVDERSKLVAEEQSIAKKIGKLITPDTETALIYRGIKALAELLIDLEALIQAPEIATAVAYQTERETVKVLLSNPDLQPALAAGKNKLSHNEMADFDAVFRFKYLDEIRKILRHLYFLDAYYAVARVARDRSFSFPSVCSRNNALVELEDVYHPQVKNAVGNSISVSSEGNVLFLTGANMAGKSTFMKSFSIALYLAHMGFPVPATKMKFAVLDGIFTTINLPDNLGMGASHFYAEVLRVKKIAQELSQRKNLLIVFDEMFRGTNVKDAYEATIAITQAFAGRKNSLFMISTHIIEAGPVLKDKCGNVRFIFLPTAMNGNQPVYSYQLQEGVTDDRHGMIIVSNEGILDILRDGIKNRDGV